MADMGAAVDEDVFIAQGEFDAAILLDAHVVKQNAVADDAALTDEHSRRQHALADFPLDVTAGRDDLVADNGIG